ncbi:hypothetical protein ACLOJK_003610 [Asimina triloba]
MTANHPPVTGRELSNPPSDGVSNLRFSNHSDHLLVSSWDKSVRLYDASANVLRGEFLHGGPVLDCCFHDDSSGFSASADCTVRSTWEEMATNSIRGRGRYFYLREILTGTKDSACVNLKDRHVENGGYVFSSGKEDILGRHDAPVRCVEYSYAAGQVITGSWDKTLKCWDPRGASGQERTLVGTYPQPERVYSLSLVGHRLVVATAGRHVNVYDLRNMSQPEQRRESSLKYQTRCVRCYPNGTEWAQPDAKVFSARMSLAVFQSGQSLALKSLAPGVTFSNNIKTASFEQGQDFFVKNRFALSSVEGRVAMEFFDLSEAGQSKKYAFKCHRKSEAGRDTVYPVNAIAFHPIYGTFATGGCDGYVNVWDGNNKKRLYQYTKYPTSIAALSFSRDGRLLAVASSYAFEEGDKPHEPDAIFVRNVNEVEVKPKPKVYPTPPP